ncbi:MAG: hypothetical protein KBH82_11870 [Syntrophorhabdaceae bacterium]|nr:hypothetical protein [Syntrophorhabdaceae bacterium]
MNNITEKQWKELLKNPRRILKEAEEIFDSMVLSGARPPLDSDESARRIDSIVNIASFLKSFLYL